MDEISGYDYALPESAIAQEPLDDRSASKLLWLHRDSGRIEHRQFREVVDILRERDLLVLNDTRVTALRLLGQKPTGGQVELLLMREVEPAVYEALVKPARRLQPGSRILLEAGLAATVELNLEEGRKRIRFEPAEGLAARLAEIGKVPLPPYIHTSLQDAERYQTVYATAPGSAAAPTAGLHFTDEILRTLEAKGVQTARVTLDISLDTFRPIGVENLEEHKMHGETCSISEVTAKAIDKCKGRIVAVGTTAVRTLESFAVGPRRVEPGTKVTKVFIKPGFSFKVIDGLFTNFHMPRTTMLVMLSALVQRESLMRAYAVALEGGYRFLSFGDSMLIL